MGLREILGTGPRIIFTRNYNDLDDLALMVFDLQGYGDSMEAAERDLIENAREIGATHIYGVEVSLSSDFKELICFGIAFGPKKNS